MIISLRPDVFRDRTVTWFVIRFSDSHDSAAFLILYVEKQITRWIGRGSRYNRLHVATGLCGAVNRAGN